MAMAPSAGRLDEPLLAQSPSHRDFKFIKKQSQVTAERHVGTLGGVLNLTKAVLGAGLLSIPRAFSLLGGLLGTAAFLMVSGLTIFTIDHGIIGPSVVYGLSNSGAAGFGGQDILAHTSYSAAVLHWVGPTAERTLALIMAVGLMGFSATFLDIIADILVGDEINPGLFTGGVAILCSCNVFPPHSGTPAHHSDAGNATLSDLDPFLGPTPLAALPLLDAGLLQDSFVDTSIPFWVSYICDRRVILLLVIVLLLLPLSLQRDMGGLSAVNALGLASLATFLASLLWLAGSALWQGTAHALPMLPDFESLGRTSMTQMLTGFGVLSVLLTANGCHANMHPLMPIIKPFSGQKVHNILVITIVITTSYYWLVSLTSYLVFGQDIKEDILTNLSPAVLQPLVGSWAAMVLAFMLRLGYMVSIMGSAVLTMFPLRQACIDLLLGSASEPLQRADSSEAIGVGIDMPQDDVLMAQAAGSPVHTPARADSLHTRHTASPHRLSDHDTAAHLLAPAELYQNVDDTAIVIKASDSNHHPTQALHGASDPAGVVVGLPPSLLQAAMVSEQAQAVQHGSGVMSERQRKAEALHVPLTVGLIVVAYVTAVTVPNIWIVISLVGSVSATVMSFIMPALVGLYALHANTRIKPARRMFVRSVLYASMLLGGLIFINGFVVLFLLQQQKEEDGGGLEAL